MTWPMTCCAGTRPGWPPRARSCPRRSCRNSAATRPARPEPRPAKHGTRPAKRPGRRGRCAAGRRSRPARPPGGNARQPRQRCARVAGGRARLPAGSAFGRVPVPAGHPALAAAAYGDPRHVPALRGLGADGKASRGAKVKGQEAPQHLGFFWHGTRLNAAQRAVDRKTNETTVIGPVIDGMDLSGRVPDRGRPAFPGRSEQAGTGPRRARHLRHQGESAPHLPGPGRHRLGADPRRRSHLRSRPRPRRDPHHPGLRRARRTEVPRHASKPPSSSGTPPSKTRTARPSPAARPC